MLALLSKCGGIEDVGLGLTWDSTTLIDEVNRRAAVLAQMGIGRGFVIAIAHVGTARFFADLLATWSVGAAAACLDATLTSGEIKNVVEFAQAAILLVDGGASVEGLSVPVVELGGERATRTSTGAPTLNPEDPALLLFTSGTTGQPKGVLLTFGSLLARIDANIATIGTPALARALVTLPTFFGHGLIGNSLTPLLAGGTIVLHPRGMLLIKNLGRLIDQHRITFMSSVPSLWRLALTCSARPKGHSLVRIHVGSAPLSAALWSEIAEWSGAEVVNCYGITETANWISGASSREDGIADGSVGRMWGGIAGVMDDNGTIRDQGNGELVIKSSCLMSGYYKRPDLTEAAFTEGWFRTGDQGLIDDSGGMWVTGRIKDEINRGGFKVQPAELDALLESHPAVAEACAFGIPDPMGGEAVAAAIRLHSNKTVTSTNLQAWCSQRLRRAAVPEHWFFVSEIPRTARGKVSRDVVRILLTKDTNGHVLAAAQEPPKSSGVAVAATFVVDPLAPALRFALQEAELAFDVQIAPYHQLFQQLRSPTSLLATNSAGINVVLMRIEDFVRDIEDPDVASEIIGRTALELQGGLNEHMHHRAQGPTLLAILPASPRVTKGLSPAIESAARALIEYAQTLPGLTLVPAQDIDRTASGDRYDKIGDELAHVPFTESYYAAIALALVKKVRALRASTDDAPWPPTLNNAKSLLEGLQAQGARPRTLPGYPVEPTTDVEREMLRLWQAIIGIDGIGVEDDYFALGGTSLIAARLFAEISRQFAVRLPLAAIVDSPTVRTLSRRLEGGHVSPDGGLIELRPGGPRQIFFVHDGVGETLLYLNLARRMPGDLSVIAIEPDRLSGVPVGHTRIEEMAACYIEEVRKRQQHGPYLLGGMCAGGVIAYEMAAQLEHAGETVDLVALLDAPAPQASKRAGRTTELRLQRLRRLIEDSKEHNTSTVERAMHLLKAISRKLVNASAWEIRRRARDYSVRARFALLRQLLARGAPWPIFVPELTAQQILNSAEACYEPEALSGASVVLARATVGEANDTPYSQIYADKAFGWETIAKDLAIIDVDGGHTSMLQEPFVKSLAGALLPYVNAKSEQKA